MLSSPPPSASSQFERNDTNTGSNERSQLSSDDITNGLRVLEQEHLRSVIAPLPVQGGCSYTVSILHPSTERRSTTMIAQLRPLHFALSQNIMNEAREVHRGLVPIQISCREVTVGRGRMVQCVQMTRLSGTPYNDLQPVHQLQGTEEGKLNKLLSDLAAFFARCYLAAVTEKDERGKQLAWSGRIGRSLLTRVHQLCVQLPSSNLRRKANSVFDAVKNGGLNTLPIVLTHGDLQPSNILVDSDNWRITGMVDWAEGEWMPFGVGLYGVEHLLGYMGEQWEEECTNVAETAGRRRRFVYYSQADDLRDWFWQCLKRRVPKLEEEEKKRAVMLARDVGILLWHGFAWDEGRLDRVINAVDDAEELVYLEAMLDTTEDGTSSEL